MARMNPNSEIMLTDIPIIPITAKDPAKLTPMPAAAQNASRKSRKSVRHNTTSASPIAAFFTSRSIRFCNSSASFCQSVTSSPGGRLASKLSARWALVAATTSRTCSSPIRNTLTVAAGASPNRVEISVSSKPSTTVATSRRRTLPPASLVRMTIFSKSDLS